MCFKGDWTKDHHVKDLLLTFVLLSSFSISDAPFSVGILSLFFFCFSYLCFSCICTFLLLARWVWYFSFKHQNLIVHDFWKDPNFCPFVFFFYFWCSIFCWDSFSFFLCFCFSYLCFSCICTFPLLARWVRYFFFSTKTKLFMIFEKAFLYLPPVWRVILSQGYERNYQVQKG